MNDDDLDNNNDDSEGQALHSDPFVKMGAWMLIPTWDDVIF